jgi:hypothetical protein
MTLTALRPLYGSFYSNAPTHPIGRDFVRFRALFDTKRPILTGRA